MDLPVPVPAKKAKSKAPDDIVAQNRSQAPIVPSLEDETDAIVEQPAASARQIVRIKMPVSMIL